MDWMEVIESVLGEAREAVGQLDDCQVKGERLHWLERQLVNVVKQLEAMMADLESGLSIADLGFFPGEDIQDALDDFRLQIANLRSMIRVEVALAR